MVNVEVVYVPSHCPIFHKTLSVPSGSTVDFVLHHSGVFLQHPEALQCAVGIFSKPTQKNTIVTAGDRIEIYRPLKTDPMEKRRLRAKK